MSSTFMQKNHYNSAYSKSHHEAPKQLLQLRSQIKPLFSSDSSDTSETASSFASPQPRLGHDKLCLTYIEKERRASYSAAAKQRQMKQSQQQQQQKQQYNAYAHAQSRTAVPPPLMRTPSSGFSSSSSSENMFSGLSISSDSDQKIREILDPAVEVDLDMFLLPDVRYNPQPSLMINPMSLSGSHGNFGHFGIAQHHQQQQQQHQSQQLPRHSSVMRQMQAKPVNQSPYMDYSYANIKRSSGYTDFMASATPSYTASSSLPSSSTVPMSPSSYIRCKYCWDTYVKLCQRVTTMEPVVTCDGPWHWHSLYDAMGRVTCPRLWFTQLDRAGTEMLEQMAKLRNAPV